MKRKSLFWAVMLAAAALLAGGYCLLAGGEAVTASVYLDGELYGTYDLTAAVIPYEVRIESPYGYNIVRVSHGAVAVAEADCAGQDCVHQGAIHDDLIPIVCLPHRLVIQIEN